MGEGAAVLVLESLEHARKRGARIYAEIAGYGASSDAHHVTQPHPEGRGAMSCMGAALHEAGIPATEVGYVNAHATRYGAVGVSILSSFAFLFFCSTPLGDLSELRAIRTVFGDSTPLVSSTKGAVGHMLGAAGAAEAAFTVLSVAKNQVPPTRNLHKVDDEFAKMDLVPHEGRDVPSLKAALTNSFGFGGTNASLLFVRHH